MARQSKARKSDGPVSAQAYEHLDIHRVLSLIPIQPHHVVADIGCGPGFFTVPLGKHVFYGRAHAIDGSQEMLDATKEQLARIHLTNVDLVLSKNDKLPLEDDSLDGAFAAFGTYKAKNRKRLLQETQRCLRKSGWLALLEWRKQDTDQGPPVEQRIDEAELLQMVEQVGFRLTMRHSLNANQYMLITQK